MPRLPNCDYLAQHSLTFRRMKQLAAPPSPKTVTEAVAGLPTRGRNSPGRGRVWFVVGEDAESLWVYFSRSLAEALEQQYPLRCRWLFLGEDSSFPVASATDILRCSKPSAREIAHLLGRHAVQIVHALGNTAVSLCQRARWLVYPPPLVLYFPSEARLATSKLQRLVDRAFRAPAVRYVTADHHSRDSLILAGIDPQSTTIIPLATRYRLSPDRAAARQSIGADPLRFVIAASFETSEAEDPQWMALEILAEMLHRGIPSLLLAGATSREVSDSILRRAHALDVNASVRCLPLVPDPHACITGADVVLLTGPQRVTPWVTLAAIDAGVPVVKSPLVRLPQPLGELPAARELVHPLARDDLHTWLDTMEDFRPRPQRTNSARPKAHPLLPTLEEVANEYMDLYRRLHRSRPRRR